MPASVFHALTATTPPPAGTTYEIQTQHWDSAHLVTLNAVGSEIVNAFSNSNGVSFGLAPSGAITASVLSNVSLVVSAGAAANAVSQVVFSNSNNVSFGLNGSTVTASVAPQGSIQFSASNGSSLGTAIAFSNANGLSFGLNNGTLTGSVNPVAVANLYGNSNTTINSSGSFNLSSLNVQGAGLVSIGMSSNTLIISGLGTTGLSQSLYFTGNTTQSSSGTTPIGSLLLNAYGAMSLGYSGGSIVASVPATSSLSGQGGITISTAGSTIYISGATGGGSGGVTTAGVYGVSNTTGAASSSTYPLSALSFAGAGIISVGNSNGSIVISGPSTTTVGLLSAGISTAGNTSGTTGLAASQLVLQGGNNITLSGITNAGGSVTVVISGPNVAGAQTGISGIIAGTQTQSSGTLSFANSNGISFGMSNSSVITASYTVPTQTSLSFSNANGVTFGVAGSTLTASVPAQSTQTQAAGSIAGIGVTTTTQAGSTLGATQSTNGLSLAIPLWLTTSPAQTSLSFSNANGLSFGIAGSTLTGSYTVPTQTAQTLGLYASSNTTGAASSTTVDARSLTFVGQGGMSVGMSAGSVVFNDGPLLYLSAGTTSINADAAGTVVFSNSNGVSFGLSGSTLTGSINPATTAAYYFGGNTTGASSSGTVGDQTISIAASGIISGGWTNGSLVLSATQSNQAFSASGGSTTFQTLNFVGTNATISNSAGSVLVSVPATSSLVGFNGDQVSTGGSTISFGPLLRSRLDFFPQAYSSSSLTQQVSASMRYLQVQMPITFSRVDVPAVFSLSSTALANTGDLNITSGLVIYSRNGSTLSPITGAFGSTTYTWASNTSNYANLTGGRNISFPISGSLSAGEYWVGFQMSTTNNSSIGTATTVLANAIYMPYGLVDTTDQYGDFGSTYTVSQNLSTMGLYTASITATAQTIGMSNILATGANLQAGNFPVIFRNY